MYLVSNTEYRISNTATKQTSLAGNSDTELTERSHCTPLHRGINIGDVHSVHI